MGLNRCSSFDFILSNFQGDYHLSPNWVCINWVYLFRQVDVKVIIAYSSLAHIELTIATIIYLGNIGTRDVILLILAHEFSSSRIFFGENSFLRKFPRRIDLIKRISNYIFPLLSFFGLITIRRRMATLPLLNFVTEIIYICSTQLYRFRTQFECFIGIFRRSIFYASLFEDTTIKIFQNKIALIFFCICPKEFYFLPNQGDYFCQFYLLIYFFRKNS